MQASQSTAVGIVTAASYGGTALAFGVSPYIIKEFGWPVRTALTCVRVFNSTLCCQVMNFVVWAAVLMSSCITLLPKKK